MAPKESETKMGGFVFLIALLIGVIVIYEQRKEEKSRKVDEHVKGLLKGGLIPRVEKEVHLEAMRKIGTENPNIKLPRREYY